MSTDDSEEYVTSVFEVEEYAKTEISMKRVASSAEHLTYYTALYSRK
jgi:hypothetical protein